MKRGSQEGIKTNYKKDWEDFELDKDAPIWVKKIVELMKKEKISQAKFAEKSKIKEGTLSLWISGKRGFPRENLEILRKVAKNNNVSLEYLLGLYECKKDDEDYMRASHIFGLEEDSMNLLKAIANEIRKNDSKRDIDEHMNFCPKSALKLINLFIGNIPLWRDLEPLLLKYSMAKALEEFRQSCEDDDIKKDIEVYRLLHSYVNEPDIKRYQIMRMFENFLDECSDKLYSEEKTKIIEDVKKGNPVERYREKEEIWDKFAKGEKNSQNSATK